MTQDTTLMLTLLNRIEQVRRLQGENRIRLQIIEKILQQKEENKEK